MRKTMPYKYLEIDGEFESNVTNSHNATFRLNSMEPKASLQTSKD